MKKADNNSRKEQKRLNLSLDKSSFDKLEKIKVRHGDSSYTQAVKRAIAFLEFIDDKREEGLDLFVGNKKSNELHQVLVAP